MISTEVKTVTQEVVDFMMEHGEFGFDEDNLKKVIPQYLNLGTFVLVRNKAEQIIGLVAFCVSGKVAEIQEAIIHEGYRNIGLLQYMTAIGWSKFPQLTHITFKRGRRFFSKNRAYRIENFLRRI